LATPVVVGPLPAAVVPVVFVPLLEQETATIPSATILRNNPLALSPIIQPPCVSALGREWLDGLQCIVINGKRTTKAT
jgi:hypothetical protein